MPAEKSTTRFPFISLEKALIRAEQIFDADPRGNSILVQTAYEAWSYSPKSSGAHQTIGALKMYGLAEDQGANETRRIALTSLAMNYFRDERDSEKTKYLQDFALKPLLISSLWEEWGATPPADSVARSHLKLDRGLNDQSARSLLGIYKDNVRFANLTSLHEENHEIEPEAEEATPIAAAIKPESPTSSTRETQLARENVELESGERELATGMLSKDATFRVIVSGRVGVREIETLIRKLEIDKEIIADED